MSIGSQMTASFVNLIEEERKTKREIEEYGDGVTRIYRVKRANKHASKARRNIRRNMRNK